MMSEPCNGNCHVCKEAVHAGCSAPCQYLEDPQKLEETNYFSFFGMPEGYAIQKKELSHLYKQIQKSVHPDKFHNQDHLQDSSLAVSVFASEAYQILNCDLKRAVYLLKIRGI
jgi:hypothetical protein